jgi:CheY-like chemotaxis protein
MLLVLVGCSRKSDGPRSDINLRTSDFLLHAEGDALNAKIVLTELRDGRSTNALELLEMQIDASIVMIDHSLPNVSGAERERALGTLRLLKAYREAHPRQREAVIQGADKQDAEALMQGSQEASHILSGLK